jgi:hypothetical protein
MDQTGETKTKSTGGPTGAKAVWIGMGLCPIVAAICFIVMALLPATDKPHFQDPLRSILTGVAVLAIATPFCLGGHRLRQRFAASPYFEGTFIATAIVLFGIVCLVAGSACILLGAYDLVVMFFVPKPKPLFH